MSLYAVTNPATGESVRDYPTATDAEIQTSVATADAAFKQWNKSALPDRVKLLGRVAELYTERRDELAAIVTREMGKPVFQAKIEVDIVASIYRYYAGNGTAFLEDEQIDVVAGGKAIVRKDGLGVLLGIMPWNFPYYQVARFAAPNLMNGNTILLKHAPQCPESALAMEQIFLDAGAPEGAYVNIFATNEQVADIIADPRVQGVSLTGSERAGSAVAEIAGRNLKKVVLELGGSDPFLVLDSANVDQAATHALFGRFGNTGQACNAAKRIIVADAVYDDFVEKFVSAVSSVKVGDPTEADTFMGPLSSTAARDSLAAQVDDAVAKGATVLVGGSRLDRPVPGSSRQSLPASPRTCVPSPRSSSAPLLSCTAFHRKTRLWSSPTTPSTVSEQSSSPLTRPRPRKSQCVWRRAWSTSTKPPAPPLSYRSAASSARA
jgi:succinate-semialdehyde dehydrogenase/glutarate-semialdehyde dehydrogenase